MTPRIGSSRPKRLTNGAGARLALSLFLLVCCAMSGCSNDHYYRPSSTSGRSFSLPTCPRASTAVRSLSIDTDALLKTEPGKGAGVLLEYTNGGHWHVYTVCDTAISGYSCEFDVTAQVIGGKASHLLSEELESGDVATSYCADTALLGVTTASDFDGLWFDAPPGATVRITAALGQTLYANIFFWTSGDVVHEDAEANPFELTPTAP